MTVEVLGEGTWSVAWRWGERLPTGRRDLTLDLGTTAPSRPRALCA
ncbi:hypothetical protein [Nonomuraea maheshkhaliensis]